MVPMTLTFVPSGWKNKKTQSYVCGHHDNEFTSSQERLLVFKLCIPRSTASFSTLEDCDLGAKTFEVS